jgi:hypothetical protein
MKRVCRYSCNHSCAIVPIIASSSGATALIVARTFRTDILTSRCQVANHGFQIAQRMFLLAHS